MPPNDRIPTGIPGLDDIVSMGFSIRGAQTGRFPERRLTNMGRQPIYMSERDYADIVAWTNPSRRNPGKATERSPAPSIWEHLLEDTLL